MIDLRDYDKKQAYKGHYKRDLAALQERLGMEHFRAAWEQGRRMTAEDAVAYATMES